MKNIIIIFCFLVIAANEAFCSVVEYFDNFYLNYLNARGIGNENREVLNLLHEISNAKVRALENNLACARNKDEFIEAVFLIDEEYKDFLENLNFEASYSNDCKLSRKASRKFKKSHKKFMRSLKKEYKY